MEFTAPNRNRALLGWIGILVSCALWIASVLALAFVMHHLSSTSTHPVHTRPSSSSSGSSDLALVLCCAAFTLLQLTSFLLFAFVFRASWRLRSAVCFALAAGLVIAGDGAGLLALLVWLGVTLGAS